MIQWVVKILKQFVNDLNSKGVPIPLLRYKGRGDLVFTMTVMSFTTALGGQVGKITKILGDVDMTAASALFVICLGAYLGNKKMSSDGKSASSEQGSVSNGTEQKE